MPRHLISDAHEWSNEIPTVPTCKFANLQPRERAWDKAAGKEDPVELDSSEIKVSACLSQRGGEMCKTTDLCSGDVNDLMGSLAGAARLLKNNADVQR